MSKLSGSQSLFIALLFLMLVFKLADFLLDKFWINPYDQVGSRPSFEALYPPQLHFTFRPPPFLSNQNKIVIRTNAYRALNQKDYPKRTCVAIGSMTTSNELVAEQERWMEKLPEPCLNYGYRGVGYALASSTLQYVKTQTPIQLRRVYLFSGLTDIRCFLESTCSARTAPALMEPFARERENYLFGEQLSKSALFSFLWFQWHEWKGHELNTRHLYDISDSPELSESSFTTLKQRIITELLPLRREWIREVVQELPPKAQLVLLTQPNNYFVRFPENIPDLRNRPHVMEAGQRRVLSMQQVGSLLQIVNKQTLQLGNERTLVVDTDRCVMKEMDPTEIYWKGQLSTKGNAALAQCLHTLASEEPYRDTVPLPPVKR